MKDGGPAFPGQWSAGWDLRDGKEWHDGMTLRDYFAAKAMQAILSRQGFDLLYQPEDGWMPEWNAWATCGDPPEIIDAPNVTGRLAYEMADAMIAAREVPNG